MSSKIIKILLFILLVIIIIAVLFFLNKNKKIAEEEFWNGKSLVYSGVLKHVSGNYLEILEKDDEKDASKLIKILINNQTIIKGETNEIKKRENLKNEIEYYKKTSNSPQDVFFPGWRVLKMLEAEDLFIGSELEILLQDNKKNIAEKILVRNKKEEKQIEHFVKDSLHKTRGKIIEIKSGLLTIKKIVFLENKFLEQTFILKEDINIKKRIKKSAQQFEMEQDAYVNENNNFENINIVAPSWYKYESVNVGNVINGAEVEVEYFIVDNENIVKNLILLN